jgi:hypothetical protein
MKRREDILREVILDYGWVNNGDLTEEVKRDFLGSIVDRRMLQNKHDH